MSPIVGISLKLVSTLTFTVMSALVKSLSAKYPIGQIVCFRSFFALIPLVIWLAWRSEFPSALRTSNLRGHLKRSCFGALSMSMGFSALAFIPLPDAVALGYAAPLLLVVLAAVVLKERVRIYRWTAVAVGFCGVLLMLSPYLGGSALVGGLSGGPAIGAMLALGSAACSAFSAIEIRQLTATERTGAIVFYFMVLTSLLGLATIAFGWVMPDAWDAMLLVGAGILGGLGQIFIVQAYRYGDASLIAPFDYTSMLWAMAIGWFFFNDWPATTVLVGAVIVIASGIYVIMRERQLGLLKRETREAVTPR